MACEGGNLLGGPDAVDMTKNLNDANARVMAIETNILDTIGADVSIGKRQDLFWIVMAVILAVVLVVTNVFKRKKRR